MITTSLLLVVLFYCILNQFESLVLLEDFGAIEDDEGWETVQQNIGALLKAIESLNEVKSVEDRVVYIPEDKKYFFANTSITSVNDLTFHIDGKMIFSDAYENYTTEGTGLLSFKDCVGVHFRGSGRLDGQGLRWWRLAYTGVDHRPNMIDFDECLDVTFQDILLLNSPKYSINFRDCANVVIHDITIFVDPRLIRGLNRSSLTYPLNTDGIDIGAYNVTVYNTNITNWDDAIVAKPCRSNWRYCQCAGNIYAYNNSIQYSTGLTIGSVPPNSAVNCVRDVYFKDTTMYRPFKALYIKSNPGTVGTGIIDNIRYENIFIQEALWWTIYIGPQQQNQPGSESGTGCNFLFPYIPICPTQPLVSITNISLKNVVAVDTIPLFQGPGVILCDPATPCTDISFANVTNMFLHSRPDATNEWFHQMPKDLIDANLKRVAELESTPNVALSWDYITSYVYGTLRAPVLPKPCFNDESCFWQSPLSAI